MIAQPYYHSKRKLKLKVKVTLIAIVLLALSFVIGFIVGNSAASHNEKITQVETPTPEDDALISEETPKTEESATAITEDHTPTEASKENESTEVTIEDELPNKVVYLTFDDGPSKLTAQFLDVLHEHNIPATFFMQGSNLKQPPLQESVKRAVSDGHYIGGHSMTHNFNVLYKQQQFVPEMKETLALIHEITGTNPTLVRPPYGSAPGLKNEAIRNQIVAAGIRVWDWTIDSNDWRLKGNPMQVVENVKQETNADTEVVLLHENEQTLTALPNIISFFKEQGYTFTVYDEANHFSLNFQNDPRL